MKISPFEKRYLDQMARLYVRVYSEPERMWSEEAAKKYLQREIDNFGQYCLQAVNDEGVCMGAVFCKVEPYYTGEMLLVDSLQIEDEYRHRGVAKALLHEVFRIAKERGLIGAHLLADSRVDFPRAWYKKLGFELTGWEEYENIW